MSGPDFETEAGVDPTAGPHGLAAIRERYGINDDEYAELRSRVVTEYWDPDEEPIELSRLQAAGIELVCRQMLTSTWPTAPPETIQQAVDVLAPNVIQGCNEGRFDIKGTDDVGGELRELFKDCEVTEVWRPVDRST